MRIYFKGYYGYNNIGDDLFVHIAKWYCENINKEATPLFIGENLPKNISYRKINNKYMKNLIEFLYVMKSDYTIYWGGSTLESVQGYTNLKYWINRSKSLKKKFLAFGVSVGPFENHRNKKSTLQFLSESQYVGVRDNESLNYCSNFSFSFDLAILTPMVFPLEKPHKENSSRWTIGVNFNNSDNVNKYYDYVKSICTQEKDEIKKVKIFVFNKNAAIENKYSESLKQYLEGIDVEVELILYNINTELFLKEFIEIDFLFGTRLHSGILAYSYGIRFVLDEYHEKCTSFIETVNNPIRFDDLNENSKLNHILTYDNSNMIKPSFLKEITLNELTRLTEVIKK